MRDALGGRVRCLACREVLVFRAGTGERVDQRVVALVTARFVEDVVGATVTEGQLRANGVRSGPRRGIFDGLMVEDGVRVDALEPFDEVQVSPGAVRIANANAR